jgi:hypothetical protein
MSALQMRCVQRVCLLGLLCASAVGYARQARAQAGCTPARPWERLPETAAEFATPLPLVLTASAAVVPFAMAPTGLDHDARVLAQRDLGGRYELEPVSLWAPFVLAGGTLVGYGVSALAGACEATRVQAALLQAIALSASTALVLKLATGRDFPTGNRDPHASDRLEHPESATEFEPFAWRLTAWPSGHAAVMFAAAGALRASLPRAAAWRFVGYPLALAVSAGMWFSDRHWASDLLSGGLLGEAIGGSVGRAFTPAEPARGLLFFAPNPGGGTLVWTGRW